MFLRTLVLSLAVVGGLSAMMCNGRTPLPARSCSQGVAIPPQALPLDAISYMAMAAGGDQFEIQSSQIALVKAVSADVRNYAQMLINDHTMMSSKMIAAAAASGLAAPAPVFTPDQQRMLNELQAAPAGFSFDQLFLRDQIMAHEMALALHSNYASAGDNSALRAVAASAVPVIQMHLSTASQLQIASGAMMATDACPATYWCNSDIDALGQSFSVCCPSDVPVFPPVSASAPLYTSYVPAAPVTTTYASAPIYAAAPVTMTYASAPVYAAAPVTTAYTTTTVPAATTTTIYASAPAATIYASGSMSASGSLGAGYIRAFGTVVPAVRVPSNTGYGNVPIGTPTTSLYTTAAPLYPSIPLY